MSTIGFVRNNSRVQLEESQNFSCPLVIVWDCSIKVQKALKTVLLSIEKSPSS